jgi:hypothetical protein
LKLTRSALTVLTLVFASSCGETPSLPNNEQAALIKEVRQVLERYYDDVRKSGLTAEFKYLDSSQDFFWVPPGYASSISYDSVATILKNNAPKYKYIDNSFETLRIIPYARHLAAYTASIKSTMIDTSGTSMTFTLVETGVVIKREEGWKLLNGQTAILNQ